MSKRLFVVAFAAAFAVSTAACSSSGGDKAASASNTAPAGSGSAAPGTSSPASGANAPLPNDPAVRWVDGFCAPIGDLVKSASAQPKIDTSNQDAMRTSLATFFGSIADQLGKTSSALKALGPSPVAGGDQAAKALAQAYDKTRTAFLETKQKLETTTDPNALAQAMSDIGPKMQELGASNPLQPLNDSKQLEAAAKQAPHCQDLNVG